MSSLVIRTPEGMILSNVLDDIGQFFLWNCFVARVHAHFALFGDFGDHRLLDGAGYEDRGREASERLVKDLSRGEAAIDHQAAPVNKLGFVGG